MAKHRQITPTDQWEQMELYFTDPVQRIYELIRPVVLFRVLPTERARQTGAAERTLYRHIKRFTEHGMASLLLAPPASPPPRLPAAMRSLIVAVKAEHPPLHLREIATMCYVRFGHRPSRQTIKRVLAETPPPPHITRRYLLFHEMDDPATRQAAIIRLLVTDGSQIDRRLFTNKPKNRACDAQALGGGRVPWTPHKSSAPNRTYRMVDYKTVTAVRQLGRNKKIGAWRLHAKLRQLGIPLSPRTCGRLLALNHHLYDQPPKPDLSWEKKPMPFRVVYRHQFWTVDIRYVDH